MELHVLMRTHVVEYEVVTEVLGVYDADHIKEAMITAESIYNPYEIWVDDFDLNSEGWAFVEMVDRIRMDTI